MEPDDAEIEGIESWSGRQSRRSSFDCNEQLGGCIVGCKMVDVLSAGTDAVICPK